MDESVSVKDFARLESKVDTVVKTLEKLVIVEERQSNQGARIGELEKTNASQATQLTQLDKKLDQWINRGIGIWIMALFLWAILPFLTTHGFVHFGG